MPSIDIDDATLRKLSRIAWTVAGFAVAAAAIASIETWVNVEAGREETPKLTAPPVPSQTSLDIIVRCGPGATAGTSSQMRELGRLLDKARSRSRPDPA